MKYEGKFAGFPVYSSPDVPENMLYLLDEDYFKIKLPRRKDGKPDMRHWICRQYKNLGFKLTEEIFI